MAWRSWVCCLFMLIRAPCVVNDVADAFSNRRCICNRVDVVVGHHRSDSPRVNTEHISLQNYSSKSNTSNPPPNFIELPALRGRGGARCARSRRRPTPHVSSLATIPGCRGNAPHSGVFISAGKQVSTSAFLSRAGSTVSESSNPVRVHLFFFFFLVGFFAAPKPLPKPLPPPPPPAAFGAGAGADRADRATSSGGSSGWSTHTPQKTGGLSWACGTGGSKTPPGPYCTARASRKGWMSARSAGDWRSRCSTPLMWSYSCWKTRAW